MEEYLKSYYIYFYKKVFKKRIELSSKNILTIKSFNLLIEKEYGESIGEDWLYNYLMFQFNKFYNANTKMKLQLNWVYGKKGLEAYKNRNKESGFFDEKFKNEFNINKRVVQTKNIEYLSKEYKSRERNKFSNLSDKILHCIELNLFDEKTADCKFCKNKNYCLKL